jgi:putative Mg2+ transporter-C (MgtC) family protein
MDSVTAPQLHSRSTVGLPRWGEGTVLAAEPIFVGLGDAEQALRVAVRLLIAVLLGAVLGHQRERQGKAAGLRTHMLVALGAALFVILPLEFGVARDQLSRVIQGVIMGIGFIGAGAIIKLNDEQQVKGLTTAAGIWLTAGVGLAMGLGLLWLAGIGTAVAWLVLAVLGRLEHQLEGAKRDRRS